MKILISREEVRIATEAHPDHKGIMLYIDTLLDTAKITKRALELACTDIPTSPDWWDTYTVPNPDDYLTQAREELKESNDG